MDLPDNFVLSSLAASAESRGGVDLECCVKCRLTGIA
jgi:hypothetical protein